MEIPAGVSSAVTDPTGVEPCPGCGGSSGVKVIPRASSKVHARSCTGCGTDWVVTVVNPRSYLDHLATTVDLAGARLALREILTLADRK
jgi:hypothetical protein